LIVSHEDHSLCLCNAWGIVAFAIAAGVIGGLSSGLLAVIKGALTSVKFQEFKKARVRFFRQSRRYLKALRSLLADNFPILGAS
jgi:hypothetical protein